MNFLWYNPHKGYTVTDQEIIEKVNSVLKDIGNFFDQANIIPSSYKRLAEQSGTTDEFFYRNLWLNDKNHRYKPNQNMFSFNADEIEKYKIPSYVVGCSGRANLFVKYATESKNALNPADIRIIPSVQISGIGQNPMHGHQIIAIKMSQGWQLINENRRDFNNAKINTGNKNIQDINSMIGQDIDALNHGKPEFKIAAVLTPEEHLQINSSEKLQNIYAMKAYKFKSATEEIREKLPQLQNTNFTNQHQNY